MNDEATGGVPFERQADAAWRELRSQLADHLATMGEASHLVLTVDVGAVDERLAGAPPYVQFLAFGGLWMRAEAVSDHYLDERWTLGAPGAARLRGLGWRPPTHDAWEEADEGSANWFLDREQTYVDEVADVAVRSLREVYGCAHPAFLSIEGDFAPAGIAAPRSAGALERTGGQDGSPVEGTASEDRIAHPGDHAELLDQVRQTLEEANDAPVTTDSDGDFALRIGSSVLYVRVWESEPTVELFAELVVDVEDRAAARREVNALNRDTILGSCSLRGDIVRFRHVLCAMPFSSIQLRFVLARVASDLDERAEELAERVGGRRFLEHREAEEDPDESPTVLLAAHPMLPVLRELLEIEEPSDRVVAGLFDGDVEDITATIDALREDPPADLDVTDAIALLQMALVYAARKRADRTFGARPKPSGRRSSQQSALISRREVDGASLDLGIDG